MTVNFWGLDDFFVNAVGTTREVIVGPASLPLLYNVQSAFLALSWRKDNSRKTLYFDLESPL